MQEFFTAIGTHIDTIIVAVIAVALGWDKYVSGSSNLRKEITAEYKERNQQLEDKVKNCLDEIHKTNLQVAELTGIIKEKDKHIESLTKILQGRNPEMMELLKEIKEGNAAIQGFIKTTYELLHKSSEELGYQTELLEGSKERNTKIDQASQSHVGDIARIPPKSKGGKKIIKRKK